jgi:16S rRNA (cytosine967-C5)-methyltransferase
MWNVSADELAEAVVEEHGPGVLSEAEVSALKASVFAGQKDYPDWLTPQIARVFGDRAEAVMAAFCERADIDLRLNTLKTTPEKALAALKTVKAEPVAFVKTAARIAAPDPSEKAPGVTVIPAFNKGWVEVQDLGSQIAASAAGAIKGAQVLDYCAGGGGKTLALAALMENTGQLYAWDRDPRRLKPLFHRAKRAGLRALQIRSPAGGEGLDDLEAKMDVVFVDAPCTGAGTWRRHPDTKWRLTEKQLETRIAEQDAVLKEAARFVKPGGRLVWVTCSFLMEENEDRLAAFLETHPDFTRAPALDFMDESGLLTEEGKAALAPCVTPESAIRLTPDKVRADGFFTAVLIRA